MSCFFRLCTNHFGDILGRFGHGTATGRGAKVSSKIIAKVKNTMSERHAAEKLFDDFLSDYQAEILPKVMANWCEAS